MNSVRIHSMHSPKQQNLSQPHPSGLSKTPPPPGSSEIRKDFPILHQTIHGKPLIYLDNAATSQKPCFVIDTLRRYYEEQNANVHRSAHSLSELATSLYEKARDRIARFLHARSSREIIFTRGATEAINLVAWTWGLQNLKPGDYVLLTEMEHHSNLVPWQLVCQRTGAKLRFIPLKTPDYHLDWEIAKGLLRPPVKLFACAHISNSLGVINPVADLCQLARSRGIVTLVDAAQSAGHLPLNVQEIGCDFLAFSGHKMCGPTGIGVLYGREELLESMPPYQAGGEMIALVELERSTWAPLPQKFEAGTPNIADAIGLGAAIEYLEWIGLDRIAAYDQELARYALEQLQTVPKIRIFGPKDQRVAIFSFLVDEIHAHDLVTAADQFGIALRGGHHCTQPLMRKLGVPATARASFYFYNTFEEADRLAEALHEIQRFFAA